MHLDRRRFLASLGVVSVGSETVRRVGASRQPTDASPYEPLGSVDITGTTDTVVTDGIAYVAVNDGFATVDVSDPESPTVLAERRGLQAPDGGSMQYIREVWPWEDRLAVAGPARPAAGPRGVFLFDVSDPAQPTQVAFHQTAGSVHNAYLEDDVVYLPGRDDAMSLVMVDITDDNPVEVGRWSPLDVDDRWAAVDTTLRTIHDVYVHEGTALLPYWDAGTWIVDVSDPADPVSLGHVGDVSREALAAVPPELAQMVSRTPGGAHHYATVDETGSLLAIGRETWTVEDTAGLVGHPGSLVGGPSGLDLYDISDPASPTHRSHLAPPPSIDQTVRGWFTTSHNFDIVDERLYTAWYFGGVTIHDVSDPGEPTLLARWRDPRNASFWTAQRGPGCVVATSANVGGIFGGPNTASERLYTFPDRAGEQPDPPSLTEWPTDVFGPAPDERPAPDRDGASVAAVVDIEQGGGQPGGQAPNSDGGAEDGDSRTNETSDDADGIGPGFGAGIAGVAGVAGYLLGNRAGELSTSPDE